MEKEYVVVVKAGVDLAAFDAELAATTGEGKGSEAKEREVGQGAREDQPR